MKKKIENLVQNFGPWDRILTWIQKKNYFLYARIRVPRDRILIYQQNRAKIIPKITKNIILDLF